LLTTPPPGGPRSDTGIAEAMITFTDRAREMVQSFLDQSAGEDLALRIGMSGSPVSPDFDLTLVSLAEQADEEIMVDGGGFAVLVRQADADRLDGATVDYVERVNESGFEVRPAKLPTTSAGKSGAPTGEIADRVRSVLDTQVNPAIAAHGGMISLVDVQATDVYVEMSGGCQGCALSRMTLRQGVERMLREAVPELTAVHDVTDHASGDNPYL
jgi:Fe/S biogenesis protein NfuA